MKALPPGARKDLGQEVDANMVSFPGGAQRAEHGQPQHERLEKRLRPREACGKAIAEQDLQKRNQQQKPEGGGEHRLFKAKHR